MASAGTFTVGPGLLGTLHPMKNNEARPIPAAAMEVTASEAGRG
ncbi:hypothetical protein RBSWK_02120 [Rhodopirellula baltica SWK14]|uniref:Uncharacterized protein n=1 Tax=Rhodopirellula baltica SWK14 TaxID=993516 RepID=L7CID1_RHOBT|nr:hypothetical protein RBSWK_02120 [Rhodopirellula baltica SWK14]